MNLRCWWKGHPLTKIPYKHGGWSAGPCRCGKRQPPPYLPGPEANES